MGKLTLLETSQTQLPPLQSPQDNTASTILASPYAEGSRFDQLRTRSDQGGSGEVLERLVRSGWTYKDEYLHRNWHALASRDIARAVRTNSVTNKQMVLFPTEDAIKFPGLISVAELLSAIPREINLKLKTSFAEVSRIFLWSKSSAFDYFKNDVSEAALRKTMILGYCVNTRPPAVKGTPNEALFQEDGNVLKFDESKLVTFRGNKLLLFPCPLDARPTTLTNEFAWMLCVALETV